jgi:hypothetical protein
MKPPGNWQTLTVEPGLTQRESRNHGGLGDGSNVTTVQHGMSQLPRQELRILSGSVEASYHEHVGDRRWPRWTELRLIAATTNTPGDSSTNALRATPSSKTPRPRNPKPRTPNELGERSGYEKRWLAIRKGRVVVAVEEGLLSRTRSRRFRLRRMIAIRTTRALSLARVEEEGCHDRASMLILTMYSRFVRSAMRTVIRDDVVSCVHEPGQLRDHSVQHRKQLWSRRVTVLPKGWLTIASRGTSSFQGIQHPDPRYQGFLPCVSSRGPWVSSLMLKDRCYRIGG